MVVLNVMFCFYFFYLYLNASVVGEMCILVYLTEAALMRQHNACIWLAICKRPSSALTKYFESECSCKLNENDGFCGDVLASSWVVNLWLDSLLSMSNPGYSLSSPQ